MSKFVQISPEGEFYSNGNKIDDTDFCSSLIKSLRLEKNVCMAYLKGDPITVESKSHPLVVQSVEHSNNQSLLLRYNYGFTEEFELTSSSKLFIDDWMRLCGRSKNDVPFVFSSHAQAFFLTKIVEPLSADAFMFKGEEIELDEWYKSEPSVEKESFWSNRYKESHTPWDLSTHHPSIDWVVPRLKLSKSKVLVAGSGKGHDAAKFKSLGHEVTGVDFSLDAVNEAKRLYPDVHFECEDIFTRNLDSKFDVVFEHTLFCAISPAKRGQLIKSWLRQLRDDACLIGVFNVSSKQDGPPFGLTEWELEQLLSPYFIINFWGRLRDKESPRSGKELFIQAQKRKGF